jgi:hypothetical protein
MRPHRGQCALTSPDNYLIILEIIEIYNEFNEKGVIDR